MAGYLLDTNVLSALIRDPGGKVARRIAKVGEEVVCTSMIVACELRFGAAKSGSMRFQQRVEAILGELEVLAPDSPADYHYAEIRAFLERKGTPVGPNDLLIAAHALSLGLTLVTGNTREFSRIPGLAVENWL